MRNEPKAKSQRPIATIAAVLLCSLTLCAQERIRLMSYNVENLFDCMDDTLTNDDDFLPQATRHWTP